MKRFLKEQSERNHMLFVTGINSGLRISDILELRVRDAKRSYFNLIEKKTKKRKRIDMTPELQRELKAYIEGKEDHEYLFKSREGINKPISRFSKQTKDLAMLQKIFNHSDQRTTLRYIGINQDAMNNAMKKFKI
ncbi:tyrosine-type recombinase/integrase [Bacillus velezensis]|nr:MULTISPECIES: tyrosine-type recombinase/integrase [Bacillus]KPD34778.1 integrase [Bacillus amyloliquefaciens]MDV9185421.1 tyrosine-type recombinase/integrase [Bacillus sp. 31]MEC2152888.1 tyrosine-type recombinase/integrase [Bacillus velezensis]MEC2154088.1 tyrosine-type recombinase/integrase [Bacillus velezensis]MED3332676.1 tyrosine-type recombinase/integrase [Bacillus velezensis]